eukprot:m.64221 g.64221  ORF g.64221 m.64221 type:complete len:90 (-) comp7242_c0_seq1:695-964(-)
MHTVHLHSARTHARCLTKHKLAHTRVGTAACATARVVARAAVALAYALPCTHGSELHAALQQASSFEFVPYKKGNPRLFGAFLEERIFS